MECGFESCPAVYTFSSTNKLEITSENKLCFQVHQGGPILHHKGDKKTSHISRQARIDIAKKVIQAKELTGIQETHADEAENNNFTRIPSLNVLRQIKYEAGKKEKLDEEPLLETVKFRDAQLLNNITFIREISVVPVRIHLMHCAVIEILQREVKYNNFLSLYLDCTGSLFNKYKDKSPFYYSLCLSSINIKNDFVKEGCSQVTVSDAIMSDHSTFSIKWYLGKFLQVLEQSTHKSHQVKKIEVDFSWAMVHSATEVFNKVDLRTYLQRSFEVTTKAKEDSSFSFFTAVHLCASHIIKGISNNLSKRTKNKKENLNFL